MNGRALSPGEGGGGIQGAVEVGKVAGSACRRDIEEIHSRTGDRRAGDGDRQVAAILKRREEGGKGEGSGNGKVAGRARGWAGIV